MIGSGRLILTGASASLVPGCCRQRGLPQQARPKDIGGAYPTVVAPPSSVCGRLPVADIGRHWQHEFPRSGPETVVKGHTERVTSARVRLKSSRFERDRLGGVYSDDYCALQT